MPELPEVETIRRTLAERLPGRRVTGVEVRGAHVLEGVPAGDFVQGLIDRRFERVGRRGKYLLLDLEGGRRLMLHLRMTGRLLHGSDLGTPGPHTHLRLFLDDGSELRFDDVRKFGRVYLGSTRANGRAPWPAGYRSLGPEPLAGDFGPDELAAAFEGREARVKSLLLDQRIVAGLGNIYADEALFRAGIHPARPAGELDRQEIRRLWQAIRDVLTEAVQARGTTFSDYRDALGRTGEFARLLATYGRKGEPCPRCGTAIETVKVAGRTSHYCPRCQGR